MQMYTLRIVYQENPNNLREVVHGVTAVNISERSVVVYFDPSHPTFSLAWGNPGNIVSVSLTLED